MVIHEYEKDKYGYWRYREYRRPAVFSAVLHKSHFETSTIKLGLTKAFRARVTEWKDIHYHLVDSLTPELLDQSGHSRMLKIGEDFFGVCDELEQVDYQRRKTRTYFLRYLEYKSANLIDAMICENAWPHTCAHLP